MMINHNDIRDHHVELIGEYTPGEYKEEAGAFLKECIGEVMFNRIMSSDESRSHPYVAAKVFLNEEQWAKYVWIERNGSLEGFCESN